MTAFDPEKLYVAVDRQRRQQRRSFRAIARDLHISQSTFTRLGRGMSLDANTLVTLMAWLGVHDVREFTADALPSDHTTTDQGGPDGGC